jgi:NAD(P)-dependent dehydrogenase (short-subunit alcohol dehydrogenase family)
VTRFGFDALAAQEKAALLGGYPGRRPGTGDEVVAALAFLLSDSAAVISGVALPVDGAYR